MDLGTYGIWSGLLRSGTGDLVQEGVRQIERLGFGTAWLPSGQPGQLERVRTLVQETSSVCVATGILNIYSETDPERTAETWWEIEQEAPGRVLLGIGVGHPQALEPGRYGPPLEAMGAYLDGLDSATHPVPVDRRALAALRPGMLRLSRDRSWGAHPYLVTPGHTARARDVLGPDALLAPEQAVVLELDPLRARAIARTHLEHYLKLTNYLSSLRWLGFDEADFADGGSDHLVDELVAWGDVETVVRRIRAHIDGGAQHVTIQVITDTPRRFPIEEWETLAGALLG